jgi:threonine 3-dehydrogenase
MSNIFLVTGANGEVGHVLIPELAKIKGSTVLALDISDLDPTLVPFVTQFIKSSVLQKSVLIETFLKNKITDVFHLAGILSTGAEKAPEKAQVVNAGGTATMLEVVNSFVQKEGRVIKFFFPSTIGVYGIPNLQVKTSSGKINENQFLNPITMYGINKLYCEMLGTYYEKYFKLLEVKRAAINLDFRCLRFPGLISAITVPTGGTSDYGPEMIHSAAKGEGYESFVRQDTRLPFMVMPDAIKAILLLNKAPKDKLTQNIYNVTSFSIKAEEIAQLVNGAFTDSSVSYVPDNNRQKIVDSWPADLDDSKARSDWGWQPDFNMDKSFKNYLIPEIKNRYKQS